MSDLDGPCPPVSVFESRPQPVVTDAGAAWRLSDEVARLALDKVPPSNPRPFRFDDLVELLSRAQSGAAPVLVPLREG